ncbi:MAG: peptide chain release factor N(5)-glutamine methyltransferase [Elusimicrobiota bacterium]
MTVGEWVAKGQAHLASQKVPEASANAEFLMASVLRGNRGSVTIQARNPLSEKQSHQFWNLIKRRARRIPLAYVLGSQPFMGLDIEVNEVVLIPRPETEELVEEASRLLKEGGRAELHILEIGTGTGCISVALAKAFPQALIFATDISAAVISLAMKNAEAHHCGRRIRFIQEDLFRPEAKLSGWADLVISNPPYIPTKELTNLEPEVQKEPFLALDGGRDGLDALRAITKEAPRHLKKGGILALEIGFDQGPAVLGLLKAAEFPETRVKKDLQGRDRIAVGRW